MHVDEQDERTVYKVEWYTISHFCWVDDLWGLQIMEALSFKTLILSEIIISLLVHLSVRVPFFCCPPFLTTYPAISTKLQYTVRFYPSMSQNPLPQWIWGRPPWKIENYITTLKVWNSRPIIWSAFGVFFSKKGRRAGGTEREEGKHRHNATTTIWAHMIDDSTGNKTTRRIFFLISIYTIYTRINKIRVISSTINNNILGDNNKYHDTIICIVPLVIDVEKLYYTTERKERERER